jgi:hypothetical protein
MVKRAIVGGNRRLFDNALGQLHKSALEAADQLGVGKE